MIGFLIGEFLSYGYTFLLCPIVRGFNVRGRRGEESAESE